MKLLMSNNKTKEKSSERKEMDKMSVQVTQIGNNVFQIIGKADFDSDLIRCFLLNKVADFAERAERNHGIPQPNNVAHTVPSNVVVHATYMFLSGADINEFLKECREIKY